MCKKVDKCVDKPRKRRIFASKIIKRTHIYINFSDEKECIFFARSSVDRLSACDNAPKFKVQGEINGAEDKMLYLEASGLDGIVALDSAKLAVAEVLVLHRSARNLLNSIVCV